MAKPQYKMLSIKGVTVDYDTRSIPYIQADNNNELLFTTKLRDEVNAYIRVYDNGEIGVFPQYGSRFVFVDSHHLRMELNIEDPLD